MSCFLFKRRRKEKEIQLPQEGREGLRWITRKRKSLDDSVVKRGGGGKEVCRRGWSLRGRAFTGGGEGERFCLHAGGLNCEEGEQFFKIIVSQEGKGGSQEKNPLCLLKKKVQRVLGVEGGKTTPLESSGK